MGVIRARYKLMSTIRLGYNCTCYKVSKVGNNRYYPATISAKAYIGGPIKNALTGCKESKFSVFLFIIRKIKKKVTLQKSPYASLL